MDGLWICLILFPSDAAVRYQFELSWGQERILDHSCHLKTWRKAPLEENWGNQGNCYHQIWIYHYWSISTFTTLDFSDKVSMAKKSPQKHQFIDTFNSVIIWVKEWQKILENQIRINRNVNVWLLSSNFLELKCLR